MFWNIYWLKIFSWIDKKIVDSIIELSEKRKYKNGEIIISEGEESNSEWYIIKKWNVDISINAKKIAELSSGDIFWEIALLNEDKRNATVKSINDVEVIVLSLESLLKIIDNDSSYINKLIIDRIEENIENQ